MLLVSRERRGLFYILVITFIERVCASPKIGKSEQNIGPNNKVSRGLSAKWQSGFAIFG